MTKIDIISGFLGAGKTTLIKKLIAEAFQGEKIVLIENEFGEIGIDSSFLKDAGIQITEMNSGCICCSLVGDFSTALQDVIETYHPDRVLIEPSGVGKLSDVRGAVLRVGEKEDICMNSLVTVADATKCKLYAKNFGEFYNDQIKNAGTIILSRTQTLKQERLEKAVEMLQEKNKDARIVTTPWDQLTGQQLLETIDQENSLKSDLIRETISLQEQEHGHKHHTHKHENAHGGEHHQEENHDHCRKKDHSDHHGENHDHHHHDACGCGHDHGHHHADEVFSSWGKETPKKYEKERLETILEELADHNSCGMILRAKGMLPSPAGEWMYFDLVPGEYEIRTGTPEYTGRICVIGSELKEEELERLFE